MNNAMKELFNNYPVLKKLEKDITLAYEILIKCYENGGKLLICGNGGSASDSEHIVGELMKGFLLERKVYEANIPLKIRENLQGALPAIALCGSPSLSTAFANDINADFVFAQQVYGLACKNDVLMGISTSGNAKNVNYAIDVAVCKGMQTIALTGANNSELLKKCTVTIKAPASETFRVQEYHLPIYHAICAELEKHFFN